MRRERKGKTFRKTLGILLSAVMLVSGIAFIPGSAIEVQAATTTKDVNLGTGGIGNPTSTGSDATAWAGSKVYYAGKECYVLDKDGKLTGGKSTVDGNMLLLTQDVLSVTQMFDDDNSDWTASDCSIRNNLNSTTLLEANKGFLGTMTSVEQNSITALPISSSNTTNGGYTAYPSTTTTDKIFLLDLLDVNNANYGFGSKATRAASSWWWLRSPGYFDYGAAKVSLDGVVFSFGYIVGRENGSVRPAFNLNLSSVLFSSASGTSKSSFGLVGSNNVGNTWKLTLKDNDTSFAATLPKTGTAGQDITVTITTVGTGTYNQTSAILEDSTGTVVAYGKIGDVGAGDMTFTIPSTLPPGSYTLHVFEEQVNTGNSTDYASREVTETITISAAPSTYDVTITPGNNMTKTSSSGAASQTVNQESAITDVVYTANSGYYFPDNYSLPSGANGLSVAVNANKTQITISGSPSATTAITLTAATEKATQSAPTGLSDGVDKIAGTTTSMEYASSANAVSWNACTADNTPVAAGTWYVRYKETDTQKAGAAASVIVTASPNPPTLYQVTVNNGSGEGTYAEGATVTITANVASSGKVFDEWTVVSGTVTLASTTNATTSFTMPAGAVEVTATYKDAPVDPTPTVTDTPSVAPTVTVEPDLPSVNREQAESFVTRYYEIALGRAPELEGLTDWTDSLVDREISGSQFAYGIIFSPEFQNKDLSDEEYVEYLYLTLLDRPSDEEGKADWVSQLNNGASREVIFAGFVNSVEYFNLCSANGLNAGYYTIGVEMNRQGAVNGFVDRLYGYCLGRSGDQGGQQNWVTQLINGSATGAQVAYGFFFSPEFMNNNYSNEVFVTILYNVCLNRAPDPDGLNNWVTALDNGADRLEVFRGFAHSDEFTGICNNYGIVRGSI